MISVPRPDGAPSGFTASNETVTFELSSRGDLVSTVNQVGEDGGAADGGNIVDVFSFYSPSGVGGVMPVPLQSLTTDAVSRGIDTVRRPTCSVLPPDDADDAVLRACHQTLQQNPSSVQQPDGGANRRRS